MTYIAITCSTKKFEANLEVSKVLITYITCREKARVMLRTGAGHSIGHQIILELFGYNMFCSYLWHKKS